LRFDCGSSNGQKQSINDASQYVVASPISLEAWAETLQIYKEKTEPPSRLPQKEQKQGDF